VRGARCSFRRGELFALEPDTDPGIIRIDRRGRARRFTDLPAGEFPSGITFDQVGRFGNRLIVTMRSGASVDLLGIDCRGRVRRIVDDAPQVEGGIAVAPRSFGPFGGDVIAVDEFSGAVYALFKRGFATIAEPSLPVGADAGVESIGFVPEGFGTKDAAYMADLGVPGAAFPGTDGVLVVDGGALLGAGVGAGDLLVATEGGAETISVSCGAGGCVERAVASGPDVTHAEGHIVFAPAP
jgi:hypothetical protein